MAILPAVLDLVRDALYRAITTPRGDSFVPVRVWKDLARRINKAFGRPLAASEELAKRADAWRRLQSLGRDGAFRASTAAEAAPVLVYFERDRNVRELERIEELLRAKGYAYRRLDVLGDASTLEFVTRSASCEPKDLPVVFVADELIGTYDALVRADVSGHLAKLVRPSAV
jgi:hypothetical protein